jgi:hypothetical protein
MSAATAVRLGRAGQLAGGDRAIGGAIVPIAVVHARCNRACDQRNADARRYGMSAGELAGAGTASKKADKENY